MRRWDGIDEFIQVVEMGSFTAAAEKLGVSKSFISKQIGLLEDRLDTRLLQRTTRKLTLTDIGEAFYEQCTVLSAQYNQMESIVADLQHKPRGSFKIATNGTYGLNYTAEALAAFSKLYPELNIEVTSTYGDVDVVAEGYDLAFRYGYLEDSTLVARQVGGHKLSLCATADYFDRYGIPQSREELGQHNCLASMQRTWYFNSGYKEEPNKVRVQGSWRSDDGDAIRAAACKGIGLAQLPNFYIREAVSSGKLQVVEQDWACYYRETWAVYPNARHLPMKVSLFLDYLRAYFSEHLSDSVNDLE